MRRDPAGGVVKPAIPSARHSRALPGSVALGAIKRRNLIGSAAALVLGGPGLSAAAAPTDARATQRTVGTDALPTTRQGAVPIRRLRVVASFSILADIAREVGGDAVEVASLVAPDVDAHVFQPTPADARRLAAADLVLLNGLGFEGWIERLIAASGYRGPVAVLTRGIEPRQLRGAADPHAWQSPRHAHRYVDNVRAALAAALPQRAAVFAARADGYRQRVGEIDRRAVAALAAVPPGERRAITPHDAFGYLGEAYGVAFSAPRGWTTDSEASASMVAAVIRQIRAEQARALFVDNTTDRRLIDRIAAETGVVVGATLYSDALSAPGTPAASYLGMLAHNTQALATALRAGAATRTARRP